MLPYFSVRLFPSCLRGLSTHLHDNVAVNERSKKWALPATETSFNRNQEKGLAGIGYSTQDPYSLTRPKLFALSREATPVLVAHRRAPLSSQTPPSDDTVLFGSKELQERWEKVVSAESAPNPNTLEDGRGTVNTEEHVDEQSRPLERQTTPLEGNEEAVQEQDMTATDNSTGGDVTEGEGSQTTPSTAPIAAESGSQNAPDLVSSLQRVSETRSEGEEGSAGNKDTTGLEGRPARAKRTTSRIPKTVATAASPQVKSKKIDAPAPSTPTRGD